MGLKYDNMEFFGKVDRVVDGDTVDLIVDLGFTIEIKIRGRLLRVNTPERGHSEWAEATEMTTNLLADHADRLENEVDGHDGADWIRFTSYKTGKYGRWLVDIEGVNDILAERWPYKEKSKS